MHNFTVSAQDILPSVAFRYLPEVLQEFCNNETFCAVQLTSQVVMIQSLQPKGREFESTCACVFYLGFFLPLFDWFNFIYYTCTTTAVE